jgi:hypothetical protein
MTACTRKLTAPDGLLRLTFWLQPRDQDVGDEPPTPPIAVFS